MHADPARVRAAHASFSSMLPTLGARQPDITQACLRPCPSDAMPIMGAVPGTANAFVCAGHNCWGILWGPASGRAMAELVLDGQCTFLDLQPFSPARFIPGALRRHTVSLQFRGCFREVEFHFLTQPLAAPGTLHPILQPSYQRVRHSAPITRAIASVSLAYFRVSTASCLRPAAVIL